MSNDKIIRAWKDQDGEDEPSSSSESVPANPAGEVNLTEEDLGVVSGGTVSTDTTYCQGTCGVPWLTQGCCYDSVNYCTKSECPTALE